MRGLALLLAVALVPTVRPACTAVTGAPRVRTVAVTIHYSHFSPASLTEAAAGTLRFTITNQDPIDHEFILTRPSRTWRRPGPTSSTTAALPGWSRLPRAGRRRRWWRYRSTLTYACHLPGHYAYGMRGPLTLTT